jgi:hypothetical protein
MGKRIAGIAKMAGIAKIGKVENLTTDERG